MQTLRRTELSRSELHGIAEIILAIPESENPLNLGRVLESTIEEIADDRYLRGFGEGMWVGGGIAVFGVAVFVLVMLIAKGRI